MYYKRGVMMGRNKYPEKSRELILTVAQELFLKKGYDQTSIQDIIEQLNGMTKGVVYHHFKSKQDILSALVGESDHTLLTQDWIGKNGLEKIQYVLIQSLKNYQKFSSLCMMRISFNSPSILFGQYQALMQAFIPKLKQVVLEGVEDGSIQTKFPEEIAEMLALYLNFIVGAEIITLGTDEIKQKIYFIQHVFDQLHIPLITAQIMDEVEALSHFLEGIKENEYEKNI